MWYEHSRAVLRAELDAYYAALYGLTRDQLRYVLDLRAAYARDFPGETFRGLKHNEVRQFGEYRARRLVLGAWDRWDQRRNCDGRYVADRPAHNGDIGDGSCSAAGLMNSDENARPLLEWQWVRERADSGAIGAAAAERAVGCICKSNRGVDCAIGAAKLARIFELSQRPAPEDASAGD